jgi:hypothetical protein
MEGLKEAIDERVSFLKEQISPDQKEIFNTSFQAQIEVLRNADPEKVALYILQKKKQMESCKDLAKFEILYSEIEALEWLQCEVVRRIK